MCFFQQFAQGFYRAALAREQRADGFAPFLREFAESLSLQLGCNQDCPLPWLKLADGVGQAVHAFRPILLRKRLLVLSRDQVQQRQFAVRVHHAVEAGFLPALALVVRNLVAHGALGIGGDVLHGPVGLQMAHKIQHHVRDDVLRVHLADAAGTAFDETNELLPVPGEEFIPPAVLALFHRRFLSPDTRLTIDARLYCICFESFFLCDISKVLIVLDSVLYTVHVNTFLNDSISYTTQTLSFNIIKL